MIALDYQDTIMAAAGEQATAAYDEAISKYKGQYILAVEGNTPLNGQGMYCIDGGKPFMDKLARGVEHAKAVVALGHLRFLGLRPGCQPQPHGGHAAAQALSQQAPAQGAGLSGHSGSHERHSGLYHHL